jgi:MoaA/NifB/PqqE/SkfB family radical SAM enzyme
MTVHELLRTAALSVPRVRRFYDYANSVRAERDHLAARLAELQETSVHLDEECTHLRRRLADMLDADPAHAHKRLIEAIKAGVDLDSARIRALAAAVEIYLKEPHADRVLIHREIGKAIFFRSAGLYCGVGLPECLVRFTYPAFLGLLLNTHCNAACFFCREADYKGTSVDFTEVLKLETAIRRARVIDLTGWGEPFLYPEFERTVGYILSINHSPQPIQITTNGSLLSQRWGELLSGKINLLVVSLNAATEKTYDGQMRYKNSQFTFARVLSNLRAFLPMLTDEDRKRIDFHMVANTDNLHEIPQFVQIAADLGVPTVSIGHYISAQRQHIHKTLWNVKAEYNDELARGQELGVQLGVHVHGRRFFTQEEREMGAARCMAPFEQIFIEPSGKTAPCCFMGNERIENVFRDGFEAVWFSDVMNKLRQKRYLPPCEVCTVFSPFDDQTSHISATLLTEPTLNSKRDGSFLAILPVEN